MVVLGVDPGFTGALAWAKDGKISVAKMPTLRVKGKTRLDIPALLALINTASPDVVVVEQATASPMMGVSSAFNFGMQFGVIMGLLAHQPCIVDCPHPTVWRRKLELPSGGTYKRNKEISRERAAEIYPELSKSLQKSGSHGSADALLLMHYGAMVHAYATLRCGKSLSM
ncbi:MAG: hypothetical protein ACRCUB_07995 [Plesiomonas shigelloides]